jgi:hypothetical protein
VDRRSELFTVFMWAVAVEPTRGVAVMAENAVASREVLLMEGVKEPAASFAQRPPMLVPSTIDVIERHELQASLTAARTFRLAVLTLAVPTENAIPTNCSCGVAAHIP